MVVATDSKTPAFALLIGVQDYTSYDPSGAADLPAGVNDIGAFCRMCRRLGVPLSNIHILTTPKGLGEAGRNVDLHGAGAGYMGEATKDEILTQLAWLAGKLGHAPGDPDAPVGLLTYSGHGDSTNGELALCPSDLTRGQGADLEGLIPFSQIASILSSVPGARDNLTVVLDCCHAAAAAADVKAPRAAKPRASLMGRPPPVSEAPLLGARMFLATQPDQTGYQSTFDATPHGALSWAMSVVLEQWTTVWEGDVKYATVTHERLRELSQGLLSALGFPQTIVLSPGGIGEVPFFHRGARDAGDVTSEDPNRPRHGIQVDPTWFEGPGGTPDWVLYTFTDAENNALGAILAVNQGWGVYANGTEYWNIPPSLSTATRLQATAGFRTSPPTFPVTKHAVYSMDVSVRTYGGWVQDNALVPPASTLWGTGYGGQYPFGFWVDWANGPTWTWVQLTQNNSNNFYAVSGPSDVFTSAKPAKYGSYLQWSVKATATPFSGG